MVTRLEDGVIHIREATVATAQVAIDTLKIGGKQVTLAVFRQLRDEDVLDPSTSELAGPVWGRVNYHPDKCAEDAAHIHVVWQHDTQLRRASVTAKRPWDGVATDEQPVQRAVARFQRVVALDRALAYLLDTWQPPTSHSYYIDNLPLDRVYPDLAHPPVLLTRHDQRTELLQTLIDIIETREQAARYRTQADGYREVAARARDGRSELDWDDTEARARRAEQHDEYAAQCKRNAGQQDEQAAAKCADLCQLACAALKTWVPSDACVLPSDRPHDPLVCRAHLSASVEALGQVVRRGDTAISSAEQRRSDGNAAWDRAYRRLVEARHLFIAV